MNAREARKVLDDPRSFDVETVIIAARTWQAWGDRVLGVRYDPDTETVRERPYVSAEDFTLPDALLARYAR